VRKKSWHHHWVQPPDLYLSLPHPCAYLPGRESTAILVDPDHPVTTEEYGGLLALGFRRSGSLVYRPRCAGCAACVPVRVVVDRFTPSRSQRRVWRRNRELTVVEGAPRFDEERYRLYRRYQRDQHDDTMEEAGPPTEARAAFSRFLVESPVATVHHDYRVDGRLVGVGVVDRLPAALSSVYYYFDPEAGGRSLGTYSILWEIDLCRRFGLPYHYLGYWVRDCPKMSYKARFQPLEYLVGGIWQTRPPE